VGKGLNPAFLPPLVLSGDLDLLGDFFGECGLWGEPWSRFTGLTGDLYRFVLEGVSGSRPDTGNPNGVGGIPDLVSFLLISVCSSMGFILGVAKTSSG